MPDPVVGPNLIAPFWMDAKFTPSAPPIAGGSGPVPTAKKLQGGIVGATYSETISAQGGIAFAVTVGSLPDGLSLDSATGVISGTPTTVETSDFTIEATDASGATDSTDFEISIVGGGSANYCVVG